MAKIYWEDFVIGQINECGRRTVSAEEIKAFAAEFDPQPMHLDEEAALATPVRGLCASGWHTCAVMMRIVADGLLRDSSSMGAPGVEEIRWLVPVRPGDTLSVRATVLDKKASRSRPELGFIDGFFEVLNDTGACVMTVRCNLMFARRETASPASLPA